LLGYFLDKLKLLSRSATGWPIVCEIRRMFVAKRAQQVLQRHSGAPLAQGSTRETALDILCSEWKMSLGTDTTSRRSHRTRTHPLGHAETFPRLGAQAPMLFCRRANTIPLSRIIFWTS